MRQIDGMLTAKGLKIGIVAARFNAFIVERLVDGALDAIVRTGGNTDDTTVVRCPGAFEIPQVARRMVESGQFSRAQLYGEIHELVSGGKKGRERDDERILIHTTGLVSQDVALAHFLYRNALQQGLGIWLPTAH